MLNQDDFNSWEFNEATSKAVKHVRYSYCSAPREHCSRTGNSYLICACVRTNTEMSYCVTPVLGFKKGSTFTDDFQMNCNSKTHNTLKV